MSDTRFKTTYETVGNYLSRAKRNDILVFGGRGLISGFNNVDKIYTYKLIDADKNRLTVRRYRAKNLQELPSYNYNQQVAVLSKNEFNQLEKSW